MDHLLLNTLTNKLILVTDQEFQIFMNRPNMQQFIATQIANGTVLPQPGGYTRYTTTYGYLVDLYAFLAWDLTSTRMSSYIEVPNTPQVIATYGFDQ